MCAVKKNLIADCGVYTYGLIFALGVFICCSSASAYALTFSIARQHSTNNHNSNQRSIIGTIDLVRAKSVDTMFNVAREFDLGSLELIEANPHIKSNGKLKPGVNITLPTAFILPPGPKNGIVLNLAELRIYYYHPELKLITTYPVGIGRLGWRTPLGTSNIIKKKAKPTWRPPASIRNSYAKKGKILPAFIGPGPKNPLGDYALYLHWPRYLIHGTNKPNTVGLRSSSGCIRMYPEDIKALFQNTTKGTAVHIVHEPIKIGLINNVIYLEAHEPLIEQYYGIKDKNKLLHQALETLEESFKDINFTIDWQAATEELKQTSGYPIAIGHIIY